LAAPPGNKQAHDAMLTLEKLENGRSVFNPTGVSGIFTQISGAVS
jgi:hypothetical protein